MSKKNLLRKPFKITAGKYYLDLGIKTKIMGIVNITPDSFSNDGCLKSFKNYTDIAVKKSKAMIRNGADLIDIGGESTRPGAKRISQKEEIKRVVPTIDRLVKITKTPISIDSYKSDVVKAALDSGASIVNNIMGVKNNKILLKLIKNYNAAVILMHIKGTPRVMQKNISYKNLIIDIIKSLRKSIENCLEIGIKSDKIIIDPGIGFGKTVKDNFEIINRLDEFNILKKPILIGTSRKSFIGRTLQKDVSNRLYGTIASVCASILNGAHIVRIHDVAEVKDAVDIIDNIVNS